MTDSDKLEHTRKFLRNLGYSAAQLATGLRLDLFAGVVGLVRKAGPRWWPWWPLRESDAALRVRVLRRVRGCP